MGEHLHTRLILLNFYSVITVIIPLKPFHNSALTLDLLFLCHIKRRNIFENSSR